MTAERKHEYRIDNIRAVAILTVVFGHSIILYSKSWNLYCPGQSSFLFDQIKRIINLYQMPLFFSLSGYLFARASGEEPAIRFFIKKAARLLIPFLIIGLLYMIPIKYAAGYPPYSGRSYFESAKQFLTGADTGHLWYLPTLFFFFAAAFAVSKLFKNRMSTWSIATLFGFVCYFFVNRIGGWWVYIRYFGEFFWSFSFGALLFWLSKALLGKLTRRARALICCIVFVACSTVTVAAVVWSEKLTLLASILIVSTVYMIIPDRPIICAEGLSKNSYGLYLFHSPLIYVTFSFALDYHPVIVAAINFLVWGSISYLLTSLLRKTSFKFIIGESRIRLRRNETVSNIQ